MYKRQVIARFVEDYSRGRTPNPCLVCNSKFKFGQDVYKRQALDPHYHEAVFAQDGGGEHGTIVQEIQKGYMSNGKVLRPSRVKVIR